MFRPGRCFVAGASGDRFGMGDIGWLTVAPPSPVRCPRLRFGTVADRRDPPVAVVGFTSAIAARRQGTQEQLPPRAIESAARRSFAAPILDARSGCEAIARSTAQELEALVRAGPFRGLRSKHRQRAAAAFRCEQPPVRLRESVKIRGSRRVVSCLRTVTCFCFWLGPGGLCVGTVS